MQVRNIQPLPDGRIDCEIEHPQFGWVPFTANKHDPEKAGRRLFFQLQKLLEAE